ncbi:MAG: hypothetical protein PHI27_08190 [Eubacteriales bacterium]|nr:hypothetical protein [Eubacteriales bacterium]MDD3882218.1 hypothetical protein [Eubacteriales bacterium]MDD4512567.1 hypothetical protein [Eubacteriales bacterium]
MEAAGNKLRCGIALCLVILSAYMLLSGFGSSAKTAEAFAPKTYQDYRAERNDNFRAALAQLEKAACDALLSQETRDLAAEEMVRLSKNMELVWYAEGVLESFSLKGAAAVENGSLSVFIKKGVQNEEDAAKLSYSLYEATGIPLEKQSIIYAEFI